MSDGQLDLEAMRERCDATFDALVHAGTQGGIPDDIVREVLEEANVRELLARVDAAQRRADEAERLLRRIVSDCFNPSDDGSRCDDCERDARAFLAGEGVSTRDDT